MSFATWEYLPIRVKGGNVTEYKHPGSQLTRIDFAEYANWLGRNGWDLVGLTGSSAEDYTAVFKRPLSQSV